jgi:hypothetical protein
MQEVTARELRDLHNLARLWHKVQTGDHGCYWTVEEAFHPSRPKAKEPFCTESQTLAYRDNDGHPFARVHCYRRPDNSIGGTAGMPDPKAILGEDGVLYVRFDPDDGINWP